MPTTDTRERIAKYIAAHAPVSAADLRKQFGLSGAMIHRHLKKLLTDKLISKKGSAPRVFYFAIKAERATQAIDDTVLADNWLTITPDGRQLAGSMGFTEWCHTRNFDTMTKLREYHKIYHDYDHWRDDSEYKIIDATPKFRETFSDNILSKAVYFDFFSYPVFGRTKWGQILLHAKLSEDKHLLKTVAEWSAPRIDSLITSENIDAVAFVPHSLPRRVPLLPYLRNEWGIVLPELKLLKITGEIVIAQKTLRKASERITNARTTIFPEHGAAGGWQRLLLIDDAVGSGATLHESAKKIIAAGLAKEVIGVALVGSVKGFEVIGEV